MKTAEIDSPTKVLIVGQHYWPETFRISDIAEGLVERGYEVTVLCGIPNYPKGVFFDGYSFFKNRRQTYKGVKIIRVPEIPRGNNSNLSISINYVSFPFFSLFYIPYLLTKKYDTILTYQLSPVFMSISAIILSRLKSIPIYFYVCDFWPHSLFSMIDIRTNFIRKLITNISYWHYRRATGIIGVFKGMQKQFVSDVGIDKDKTLYIPQAPEKIYEKQVYDDKLNTRFKGKFNIVFAGNINPAQGFDTITKAAKIVYDKGIENINYIIIGEGMSKIWLMDEVKSLGIESQFTFESLKPVEEIPKYQTIADALIVALAESPLFEYGIPAKVNSYMASGKPILGAMNGEGQRLINKMAKCGICVNSGDFKGLAKSIEKLVNLSQDKRLEMGNNGKEYYFQHFERERNLDRLIEFVIKGNRIPDKEYED